MKNNSPTTVDASFEAASLSTTAADDVPLDATHWGGTSLTATATLALLRKPQEIAVCGHVNPDGDALGSILALSALLESMGHTVHKLLPKGNQGPHLYCFFERYAFMDAKDYTGTPDLFIAVDLPNIKRLGHAMEVFERAKDNLVIDHHPDYSGFGNHYYGSDKASATGMLIWDLIKASNIEITPQLARYCYVALMTDTGHFAFQNTTAEALFAAGEMVEYGVDPAKASSLVYDSRTIGSLKLDGRLISRIAFAANGKVVYSWITQQDLDDLKISRDETEGLPSILRSVKGAEIAILLRQEKSKIRINLRAKGDYDVCEFAHRFDGGGHKAAAGFTLYTSLEEAIELVRNEADSLIV